MKIRIGTRGSKLARWQAEWVSGQLQQNGVETELVFLKTLGDVKSGSIAAAGSQGVFTKAIQQALLDNQVDLAVHSLKDLPTDIVDGLSLVAVPPRESCGDALIARVVPSIDELPQGGVVATGSARRKAQLLAYRNDLQIVDIRGNVDTRLQKLHEDRLDAIILAEAGLRRLSLEEHITQVIDKQVMLPAVGQGALGLEARENDESVFASLQFLDHTATRHAVIAERAMLRSLRGGCLAPVGAWARPDDDGNLELDGIVLSEDGRQRVSVSITGPLEQPEALGILGAERLLAQGAAALLDQAR